ncbi:cytochrome P450 [Lasiosphaeria miniovina]|uniref:Cytochrome P450 n=1 Tax=Lasiosphaeria miniovina TaxID=1954250 RepID=A0AA40AKK1_9PEZI|nr:cytochrome P450 [Lasiosphaeria miniovina]KAK0717563.1 cytochrome P450 [Lasiosphaeria miniovina]
MYLPVQATEHPVAAIALAGLVVYYLVVKVQTYYRLRAFKGPFSTGFSEVWHMSAIFGKQAHLKYKETVDKYGPIARIGPNDLITSSQELLAHMNGVRSEYTRADWYYLGGRFRPGKDNIFSQVDETQHQRRRQQMLPGYTGKENLELEGSMDARIVEFMDLIRRKYLSTESQARPVDLTIKIQYFVLDVITSIGFSSPLGDLIADADLLNYSKATETAMGAAVYLTGSGLAKRLARMPWLIKLVGPSEHDAQGMGRLVGNAREIVAARVARGDMETRSDMMASFSRHGLTPDELVTECQLQVLAGSHTTAASLWTLMLYVTTHPRVLARLQAEIDGAVRDGLAPDVVANGELSRLPYLQAVIREGLRIRPPVTNIDPKRVPDGGDTVVLDGKPVFLPGGANIGVSVWAINFDKTVFGDDVDEFRPERWLLETDEKKLAQMTRATDLIFGHGKFQCLGKPVALMEIGKTVFELLRNFDWSVARPQESLRTGNYVGLFLDKPMWMHAAQRTPAAV